MGRRSVYGMQGIGGGGAPLESSDSPEQTEASNKRGKPVTAIARFPSCQEPDRFGRGRRVSPAVGPVEGGWSRWTAERHCRLRAGQRNRAQFHTRPRLRRHI